MKGCPPEAVGTTRIGGICQAIGGCNITVLPLGFYCPEIVKVVGLVTFVSWVG